ncbi:MAG: hypothetical protein KA419_03485 [Acidobacteria bacterium]|nr:hypothetical protein [Acidobacteriota bacterium]
MRVRTVLYPFLAILLLPAGFLRAGDDVHTPKPGSEERKAVMDAVRKPVEAKLKESVMFQADVLNVGHGHAFAILKPLKAATRGPIDWASRPEFAEEVAAEVFSGLIVVLLEQGKNGEWRVLELVWGPSDVCYEPWPGKYKLPEKLFGMGE